LVKDWSKDPSTKVGAVIVRDRRILATGYNGVPSLIRDNSRILDRDWKMATTVHAEVNAIFNAAKNGASLSDSILYTTMFPCSHCTSAIIQSGISKIYMREECQSENWPDRWQENFSLSKELLSEAGILIKFI
jgi:dCMP deaminase